MENEENPKTKVAQSLASLSWFSIGRKTFAYLLREEQVMIDQGQDKNSLNMGLYHPIDPAQPSH